MKTASRLLPLAALLAGCASPPPPSFRPLDYSYLPPIVLKVAALNVVNNYVPTPDAATLTGEDPAPPGATLLAMLQRRLVPSGQPGNGTVTIQDASLTEAGGMLSGRMTVDVNLASPGGHSTGFTEVSVAASQTAPGADASQTDMQTALYQLTGRLMDSMNVQLQYQIQHTLPNWVSATSLPGAVPLAGGAAVAPGAIAAAPLTAPGSPPAPASPAPASGIGAPHYLPGAIPVTP